MVSSFSHPPPPPSPLLLSRHIAIYCSMFCLLCIPSRNAVNWLDIFFSLLRSVGLLAVFYICVAYARTLFDSLLFIVIIIIIDSYVNKSKKFSEVFWPKRSERMRMNEWTNERTLLPITACTHTHTWISSGSGVWAYSFCSDMITLFDIYYCHYCRRKSH